MSLKRDSVDLSVGLENSHLAHSLAMQRKHISFLVLCGVGMISCFGRCLWLEKVPHCKLIGLKLSLCWCDIMPDWYHFVPNLQLLLSLCPGSVWYTQTFPPFSPFSLCMQEQLLLEPMFEVPGSDISHVLVEEDTARGYHPARYLHNDPTSESGEGSKADRQLEMVEHRATDTSSEIKTSVL